MSRLLRGLIRWIGFAFTATILAETMSTQGKVNLGVFGLLLVAFLLIFAGPGVVVEIVRLVLDREPDHVGNWSRLIAFAVVASVGLGSVWMLGTDAFSKRE